jgi:hypothetical protein
MQVSQINVEDTGMLYNCQTPAEMHDYASQMPDKFFDLKIGIGRAPHPIADGRTGSGRAMRFNRPFTFPPCRDASSCVFVFLIEPRIIPGRFPLLSLTRAEVFV